MLVTNRRKDIVIVMRSCQQLEYYTVFDLEIIYELKDVVNKMQSWSTGQSQCDFICDSGLLWKFINVFVLHTEEYCAERTYFWRGVFFVGLRIYCTMSCIGSTR